MLQEQSTTLPQAQQPDNAGRLILDSDSMGSMMKLAEFMAKGKISIPEKYKGNAPDCLAVIMQSVQWKMNPYSVIQKTYPIKGKMGYEGQLVHAVIIANAPIQGRLHFEWQGDWEKIKGKFETKDGENGKYYVKKWSDADEKGLSVIVSGTLIGETEPRVRKVELSQVAIRNSPQWIYDPEQQITYLGVLKWSRINTPEVIMGVYTPDELGEQESVPEKDVTASSEVVIDDYSDEEFNKNFPTWEKAILNGKANSEHIKNKVSSIANLTQDQLNKLKNVDLQRSAILAETSNKKESENVNATA